MAFELPRDPNAINARERRFFASFRNLFGMFSEDSFRLDDARKLEVNPENAQVIIANQVFGQ